MSQNYLPLSYFAVIYAAWVTTSVGEIVTLEPLGITTYEEGRDIVAVRIGPPGNPNKPKVLIIANQHARESLTPMTALYVADAAIDGYFTDPYVQSLIDDVELIVVLTANPDGYLATWEGGLPFWRKNRHHEGYDCKPYTSEHHYGVDLNRNWDADFGGAMSSGQPCSQVYHGVCEFSEVETDGLKNFIANNPSIVFLLDVHSYAQVIGWPYSYDDLETEDEYTFSLIGNTMRDIIHAVHPYGDWAWGGWGPIKHTNPYACGGTITDWSYSERGIFSFDFEIRPHYSDTYSDCPLGIEPNKTCRYEDEPTYDPAWPYAFRPSPTYIVPSGQEVWEAVKYLMERARTVNVIKNQLLSSGNYYGSAIIAGPGVTVSGNVMFSASDYVHLKPGFHALSGSSFQASIQ